MRIELRRREIADTPINPGDGQSLRVNYSAGVAGSPEDTAATTPKVLLTAADARLLAANRAERGRCVGED